MYHDLNSSYLFSKYFEECFVVVKGINAKYDELSLIRMFCLVILIKCLCILEIFMFKGHQKIINQLFLLLFIKHLS